MNKSSNTPPSGPSEAANKGNSVKPDRKARAAEALRANLRRRKAQSRGRKAESPPENPPETSETKTEIADDLPKKTNEGQVEG